VTGNDARINADDTEPLGKNQDPQAEPPVPPPFGHRTPSANALAGQHLVTESGFLLNNTKKINENVIEAAAVMSPNDNQGMKSKMVSGLGTTFYSSCLELERRLMNEGTPLPRQDHEHDACDERPDKSGVTRVTARTIPDAASLPTDPNPDSAAIATPKEGEEVSSTLDVIRDMLNIKAANNHLPAQQLPAQSRYGRLTLPPQDHKGGACYKRPDSPRPDSRDWSQNQGGMPAQDAIRAALDGKPPLPPKAAPFPR
jgi:hypothetical protein